MAEKPEDSTPKYANEEEAYNAAAKAANVEDTVEALAYLRDRVKSLNTSLGKEKETNEGLTSRVSGLTDKLSEAMLSVPINDEPKEKLDDNTISLDDLLH